MEQINPQSLCDSPLLGGVRLFEAATFTPFRILLTQNTRLGRDAGASAATRRWCF